MSLSVARREADVAVTLVDDGDPPSVLFGGFIPLPVPNHFIFQVVDAAEDGKPANKKPGSTVYVPLRVAADGSVSWYTGPAKNCAGGCAALLSGHGFGRSHNGDWHAPKDMTRAATLAFYRALAPLLEADPDGWQMLKAVPAAAIRH